MGADILMIFWNLKKRVSVLKGFSRFTIVIVENLYFATAMRFMFQWNSVLQFCWLHITIKLWWSISHFYCVSSKCYFCLLWLSKFNPRGFTGSCTRWPGANAVLTVLVCFKRRDFIEWVGLYWLQVVSMLFERCVNSSVPL